LKNRASKHTKGGERRFGKKKEVLAQEDGPKKGTRERASRGRKSLEDVKGGGGGGGNWVSRRKKKVLPEELESPRASIT